MSHIYIKDTQKTDLYICMDDIAVKVPARNRWSSKYLSDVSFSGGTLHREDDVQDTKER